MIPLVESSLKVALIVLFALGVMPLLRSHGAALRHWVLAAALGCAAVAPAVRPMAFSWSFPIALVTSDVSVPRGGRTAEIAALVLPGEPRNVDTVRWRPPAPSIWRTPTPGATLLAIWMGGAVLGIALLLVGLRRLARFASGACRISRGAWAAAAEDIRREYGLRGPVTLLQSHHPTLLVTWGVRRPKVLLPASASEWPADRIRLVLAHELAHIRRGDWIAQLAAELLRAVYWFNPLVWIACSRLRQESELACDDAVLNRGVDGAQYATELVDIARELRQRTVWLPAPSMARTSGFERRIRAMLDARVNRRPISRSACAAALAVLLTVTVFITSVAFAQVFGAVSGSVMDPMNGVVPDVTVVLTNIDSQAKYEVRSDRSGRYEFAAVAPGDYLLEAQYAGFAPYQERLTLGRQNVQRDLRLEVGSLQETVTISDKYTPGASANRSPPIRAGRRAPRAAALPCDPSANPGGGTTGGNIRPPRKLIDVRPQYPASMLSAGIEGTVALRARIGTGGTVEDVDVVSAPHPDLAEAATEAVRQWEFDGTLLNCVPIDVTLNVTLNFQLER